MVVVTLDEKGSTGKSARRKHTNVYATHITLNYATQLKLEIILKRKRVEFVALAPKKSKVNLEVVRKECGRSAMKLKDGNFEFVRRINPLEDIHESIEVEVDEFYRKYKPKW